MQSSNPSNHQSLIDWRPWVLGGSIFYLASAACILLGVYQIVVPMYHNPDMVMEKFFCLLTLSVYELMVLGVTLLIVLWRHVTDDAVLLAILVAVLLIGSATALDTVAPDFPGPVLAFGAAGLLMAVGKLAALGKWVTGRLRGFAAAGLGLLLIWNFLMPGTMGLVMAHGHVVPALRQLWLASGLVALAGGGLFVAELWRGETGRAGAGDENLPLLRTAAMRWTLMLILLVGVYTHQFALNWSFGLNFRVGDMLPALALVCFLITELQRGFIAHRDANDLVPLIVPLVVIFWMLIEDLQSVAFGWNLGVLSTVPVVALAMAAVVELLAWHHSRILFHGAAVGYLVLACWGFAAQLHHTGVVRGGWLLIMLAFPILLMGAAISILKPVPRPEPAPPSL